MDNVWGIHTSRADGLSPIGEFPFGPRTDGNCGVLASPPPFVRPLEDDTGGQGLYAFLLVVVFTIAVLPIIGMLRAWKQFFRIRNALSKTRPRTKQEQETSKRHDEVTPVDYLDIGKDEKDMRKSVNGVGLAWTDVVVQVRGSAEVDQDGNTTDGIKLVDGSYGWILPGEIVAVGKFMVYLSRTCMHTNRI